MDRVLKKDSADVAIFMRHRAALIDYAAPIVGCPSRAEDVVQEAFLRFRAAAADRVPEEPVGYLYRIVRNLAIDSYRRQTREGRVVAPVGAMLAEATADDAPSPERVASARDEIRLLNDALADLPERTRIALEMQRFGGYKLREIADRLGISVTATHEIIAAGIAHCRRRVRPDK